MASERDDFLPFISVKLDGKNYSYWNYVMKNFLIGKKMWGYVGGSKTKPLDQNDGKFEQQLDVWEVNNSKIITWINNSVEHSIGIQLVKYDTAKEVWDHLQRLYTQSNFAKQYQLEIDIRSLQQKNMSIQEFYSAMTNLWDQLALTESQELQAFAPYIARREEQRLVQFLMALRDDFETLRGNILHHTPLPSVDSVVNELLAEEIRHKSQTSKGILSSPDSSVLLVPTRSSSTYKNKSNSKVANDECSYCKYKGHWKAQCPELLNRSMQQQSQQSQPPKSHSLQFNPSRQRASRPFQPSIAAVPSPKNSIEVGNRPSFAACPSSGDQRNAEDSVAEDPVQSSAPSIPIFGQPTISPSPPGLMFGSAAPLLSNPFQFGGLQNQIAPLNPSPFPASVSLEFNSFSLGSGGADKSGRKFVKANRNKNGKK